MEGRESRREVVRKTERQRTCSKNGTQHQGAGIRRSSPGVRRSSLSLGLDLQAECGCLRLFTLRHVKATSMKGISGMVATHAKGLQPVLPLEPLGLEPFKLGLEPVGLEPLGLEPLGLEPSGLEPTSAVIESPRDLLCAGALHSPTPPAFQLSPGRREARGTQR